LLENLHSVNLGQLQIEQDQFGWVLKRSLAVRSGAEKEVQRFLAVAGNEHVIGQAFCAQGMQSKVHIVLTIIDQKNIDHIGIHS
jgi:hypothetical protein